MLNLNYYFFFCAVLHVRELQICGFLETLFSDIPHYCREPFSCQKIPRFSTLQHLVPLAHHTYLGRSGHILFCLVLQQTLPIYLTAKERKNALVCFSISEPRNLAEVHLLKCIRRTH